AHPRVRRARPCARAGRRPNREVRRSRAGPRARSQGLRLDPGGSRGALAMTSKETFLAAFADLDRRGLAGPGWLRERRSEAITRFAEIGLPTPRDEDWKYTPLAPITATTFDMALDEGDGHEPSEEAI